MVIALFSRQQDRLGKHPVVRVIRAQPDAGHVGYPKKVARRLQHMERQARWNADIREALDEGRPEVDAREILPQARGTGGKCLGYCGRARDRQCIYNLVAPLAVRAHEAFPMALQVGEVRRPHATGHAEEQMKCHLRRP